MLDKAIGWMRSLTEAGLALIALGVVLQIIFGATVPFIRPKFLSDDYSLSHSVVSHAAKFLIKEGYQFMPFAADTILLNLAIKNSFKK